MADKLLHPTRYREVLPDFIAYDLLKQAQAALAGASSGAAANLLVTKAIQQLHPCASDPLAQAEMVDLLRAEDAPTQLAQEQAAEQSNLVADLATMRAQLDQLLAAAAKSSQPAPSSSAPVMPAPSSSPST